MEGVVAVSHVMPAPAVVWVNDQLAAENCDAEELPVVSPGDDAIITWEPVTESHPNLGDIVEVEVQYYEVVVEIDDTPWKTGLILSPGITAFQVPQEILDMAALEDEDEVKFEVLVRIENNNQTAVESCFVIAEDILEDEE